MLRMVWTAMLWIRGVESPDLSSSSGSSRSTERATSADDTLEGETSFQSQFPVATALNPPEPDRQSAPLTCPARSW